MEASFKLIIVNSTIEGRSVGGCLQLYGSELILDNVDAYSFGSWNSTGGVIYAWSGSRILIKSSTFHNIIGSHAATVK